MDKDPIREEVEALKAEINELQNEAYEKEQQDLREGLATTGTMLGLEAEITALRSHNLELVEALNKIYSMPISSGFGDEQRIAQKALSSPPSEKYLKMVRVADFAERHLSSGWKEVYIGWRRMMNKVILSPDEHERFIEALKSYNSEKGGE